MFVKTNIDRKSYVHHFHAREQVSVEGDSVLVVKNFSSGDPWVSGIMYSKTGPVSFTADLQMGGE